LGKVKAGRDWVEKEGEEKKPHGGKKIREWTSSLLKRRKKKTWTKDMKGGTGEAVIRLPDTGEEKETEGRCAFGGGDRMKGRGKRLKSWSK